MGQQSRNARAMDAQTRQAEALERIAAALERLANQYTPVAHAPNPELHYDDDDFLQSLEADIPPEDYKDG